jgi:hypothetical protein
MAAAAGQDGVNADHDAGDGAAGLSSADGQEQKVREAWLQAKSACAAPNVTVAALKKSVRRFMTFSERLRKKQQKELEEMRATTAALSEELAREKIAEKQEAGRKREPKRKSPEAGESTQTGLTSFKLKLCVSPFDTSWKNPKGEN